LKFLKEYVKKAEMQKCCITGITWILEMEEKGCYLPEKDYPCINKYTEAQMNTPKVMCIHQKRKG